MAQIPSYRQRELPSTNIGAAPLSVSAADVNAGAIGRGLTNVGQGVADVGNVLFQIKAEQIALNDSINSAKIDALERASREDLATRNSQTDITFDESGKSSWEKNAEESWNNLNTQIKGLSLSKQGQKRIEAQKEIWQLERSSGIRALTSETLAKKAQAATSLAVEEAIMSGNQTSIDLALKNFNDNKERIYGARQDLADAELNRAMHNGTIRQIQNQIVLNPEESFTKLQAELDARKEGKTTNKQWKESLPDSKDIDDLLTTARSILNRNDDKLEKEQDKQRLEFYEKAYIKNEPLTWEEVKGSILEDDDKISFWNSYSKAQEEKQKAGISQLEEGDPIVLAKTTAAIDLAPERITEKNIWELADKGVGLKNASGLVNRLRAAQKPDKDPIKDKYNAELSRLHAAELFGDKDEVKTSDTYLKLQRKLDVFLTSKPTDEQTRLFFANLIREDVSWGHSFGANELPGFGESPLQTTVQTKAGAKPISITYGDIVEIDGQYTQAVGRKNGKIIWQPVNPQ